MSEKAEEFGEMIRTMEQEIQKGYIGQEEVINQILLTVVAGGNVLLEGVPGLGKSLLVEQLGRVVEGTSFNRIQFTPDKLPSDIVGVEAYNEDKGFYVEKGPIFANFILADEINRAPPKVQSAMLEAMQEHKVSIGDQTFHLPEPFFTLATQNPTEQGGSLHPEETVYLNGELMKAKEALELAKSEGEVVHEDEDKRIYEAEGLVGNHLNSDGNVEETGCMVYEKDYEGDMYTIETRTGRSIEVNATHPLLVNDSGRLRWKKAEDLKEDDFLVHPETVDLPEKNFSGHEEVVDELQDEFNVIKEEEIEQALNSVEDGSFSSEDVDRLRIVRGLSKKELARRISYTYDQVLGYLQGVDNGAGSEIVSKIDTDLEPISTYVESHNIHRIDGSWDDSDAGFFLGFTLAEGHVTENKIEVSQKNYPEMLDRWIELVEKQGLEVETRIKEGIKHAVVRSKPFVRYLKGRYHMDNPSELLSAPRSFKEEFIDSFMKSETYYEADEKEDNYRITLTQQNRELTETLTYLLIDFGIRPLIYDEGDKYRVRVSDKSLKKYLQHFTWPGDDEPEIDHDSSSYRVLPVDRDKINEVVENLGFKNCGDMEDKAWYPAYHMARQRGRITEYELEKFVKVMDSKLEERKNQSFETTQEKALAFGIGMSEIVDETSLTKHSVWQTYKSDSRSEVAEEYIEREIEVKTARTENILSQLEKFVSEDVFYDPVQQIEKKEGYEGKVIGLSVPETHNYIAGNAATGINHNTYPLPEAQIDRFLFKIYLDYPKKRNEQKIIDMNANIMDDEDFDVGEVVTQQDVLDIQEFAKQVTVSQEIKEYIVDLVDCSRNPSDYGLEYGEYIEWGCTPRASINLALAARAHALYNKRHYVTPEDIRAIIEPVFIHRILLNYEGEAQGVEVQDIIQDIVETVPVR